MIQVNIGSGGDERATYIAPDQEPHLLEEERRFLLSGQESTLCGLAHSGGGIRSAAFSLGVQQALVASGKLAEFHYLSTVSGGGYLGTGLTWWLHRGLPTDHEPVAAGTGREDFPFGSRSRTGPVPRAQNAILDFVRQHASYLQPTKRLSLLSAVAVVLRASFLSLFVHFTLVTGLLGLVRSAHLFDPLPDELLGGLAPLGRYLPNPLVALAIAILLLLAVMAVGYALSTRVWRDTRSYAFRTAVQERIGALLSAALGLLSIGVLPVMYMALDGYFRPEHELSTRATAPAFLGAASTAIGTLLGAHEGRKRVLGEVATKIARTRPVLGLGFLAYGLLISSLGIADGLWSLGSRAWGFLALSLLGVALGLACNINYLGLHRMYRDRLMELFLPSPSAVQTGEWRPAELADGTGIHQVCGVSKGACQRPYHLINANVVLVGSDRSDFRGRGGDAFLLSPLYCGSRATGWIRSDRYMNARGGRGMSLASAMAISGAAVNPNAGVGGRGVTRSRAGSILLSLLNLRLGYFAPNPAAKLSRVPNFIFPGLSTGLFGRGLAEDARLVELTDGGHFENLGVYELIRRRVDFILVTDGGQDQNFEFSDLANLVERVRVDFGVKIAFLPDFDLPALIPQSGELTQTIPLAQRAFALAEIRYPEREIPGRLVYIKSSLIPGLPADIVSYKRQHDDFPHESTGDQFFDEQQFEAYRELGYHAGWNYLEARTPWTSDDAPQASTVSAKTEHTSHAPQ